MYFECYDLNFDCVVEVLKFKGAFDVVRVDVLFGSVRLRNIRVFRCVVL